MPSARRFLPPWRIDEQNNACFIVRDNIGQALAYFYFEDEARSALGGQAAQQGRGPPHGGELRQAAGAAAGGAADKRCVTRLQPHTSRQSANVRLSSNSGSIAASRQVT
jgi:hypothetical protein